MRFMFASALACFLLASAATASPARAPLPQAETITVNAGRTARDAIVYKPSGTEDAPVVLIFHGGGGGAGWMTNKSRDLTRTLTGAGYTVVYMNGSSRRDRDKLRTWNAVHCCAYAARARINEAAYADAVIDTLDARLGIDRTRIFLIGHSNGAMLSYRLAGAMKTAPRAVASFSGAIFADQPAIPARTSIFMYHAVDDDVLSYDANPNDKAERWRTAPHVGFIDAEARLAAMKACSSAADLPAANSVEITRRSCDGASELVAVTGLSGGHDWPSRPPGYSIEEALLNFFERQR
ncbi:MAG: alpha/beta hydrolase family esterase [Hyphomonas sp.]